MSNLKLSLLGGLEIGGELAAGSPLTRKARALLAYLALRSGHSQSREKLAALFWGQTADPQARTNLRQTLSALRKALSSGSGAHLLTEGDHVALDLNGIVVDVARFEELVAGSTPEDLEQAVALYRGDLLDGFGLREEGFEEWVRGERERLRAAAVTVLDKLVTHYCNAQDFGRCVQSAIRLLALDPLREDIHRALMRAYAAQGRLSLALKQYDICREALQRELAVQPEPETQKLLRELRARRARSNGPEPAEQMAVSDAQIEDRRDVDSGASDAAGQQPRTAGGPPLPERPSVVVLAFENKGSDPDQAYFADGITENIITGLTRFRDLFVIALKSSLIARTRAADVNEIGRQLGVAHVVDGSVRKAGSRVRVTVQLIDAASTHRIWAEQYDRCLDDIFVVQDEITDVIVATLAGRIEEAGRLRATQKPPQDMAAYDYLLRAREAMRHYRQEGERAARSCLERALRYDPKYAAAHAALAYSYIHEYESTWSQTPQTAIERAYALAQAAVALDETDSVAHRALAYACHYRGMWELAKREIDRAMALNPNDYPNLCVKSWILLFSGQPVEALVCLDEALRLNPFAPDNCYLSIGVAEYTAHRYSAASETFGKMSSWDTLRYACLAACHGQLGQEREARAAAAKWLEAARAEFARETVDPMARWRSYVDCMFRFRKPGDLEHLLDGLRKVGLPI